MSASVAAWQMAGRVWCGLPLNRDGMLLMSMVSDSTGAVLCQPCFGPLGYKLVRSFALWTTEWQERLQPPTE